MYQALQRASQAGFLPSLSLCLSGDVHVRVSDSLHHHLLNTYCVPHTHDKLPSHAILFNCLNNPIKLAPEISSSVFEGHLIYHRSLRQKLQNILLH